MDLSPEAVAAITALAKTGASIFGIKKLGAFAKEIGAIWIEPAKQKRLNDETLRYELKKAENQVAIKRIEALGDIENAELIEAIKKRFVYQETIKQIGINETFQEAAQYIDENANEEPLSEDFKFRFIEDVSQINDKYIRSLFAKILAGEINQPGTFSLRTLDFLRTFDNKEAQKFCGMSRFFWESAASKSELYFIYIPQISDRLAWYSVFADTFEHFVSIGLFKPVSSFNIGSAYNTSKKDAPKSIVLFYDDNPYRFSIIEPMEYASLNYYELTKTGREIYKLCGELYDEKLIDIFKENISEYNLSIKRIKNNFVRFYSSQTY